MRIREVWRLRFCLQLWQMVLRVSKHSSFSHKVTICGGHVALLTGVGREPIPPVPDSLVPLQFSLSRRHPWNLPFLWALITHSWILGWWEGSGPRQRPFSGAAHTKWMLGGVNLWSLTSSFPQTSSPQSLRSIQLLSSAFLLTITHLNAPCTYKSWFYCLFSEKKTTAEPRCDVGISAFSRVLHDTDNTAFSWRPSQSRVH